MDKETLSNYGWIVICVLVLAVMIALAGPFGTFVAGAVKSTTAGLFGVNQNALGAAGIEIGDQAFDEGGNGGAGGNGGSGDAGDQGNTNTLPEVGKTAEEYTWAEIKAISEAGKGDEYFNLGDTKSFTTTDGTEIVMQIVAFNADIKADGTGTAGISWVSRDIITTRVVHSGVTNAGGWENSELRAWFRSDLYNMLPADVKSVIAEVQKTYFDHNSGSPVTKTCNDSIWIPSAKEVYGESITNYNHYCEASGADYTNFFTDDSARTKNYSGSETHWWLRSASDSQNNMYLFVSRYTNQGPGGFCSHYYSSVEWGVVLGFCT